MRQAELHQELLSYQRDGRLAMNFVIPAGFDDERGAFIKFLRLKAAVDCIEPNMIASGALPAMIIGTGTYCVAMLLAMIEGILAAIAYPFLSSNARKKLFELCESTMFDSPIYATRLAGLISSIPGIIVGGIATPFKMAWLLHNRTFCYTASQVNMCCDILDRLGKNGYDQIIYELCKKIVLTYGTARFATSESKRLLQSLYDHASTQSIVHYLMEKKDLCTGTIVELCVGKKIVFHSSVNINQGKRLFNTIIHTIIHFEPPLIPDEKNIWKRRDIGVLMLTILPLLRRVPDVVWHVISFLYASDLSNMEQIMNCAKRICDDVKAIGNLQQSYKKNVGFFDINRSKEIFRAGERYEFAVLRMRQDAEKNPNRPSYQTLKECSLEVATALRLAI